MLQSFNSSVREGRPSVIERQSSVYLKSNDCILKTVIAPFVAGSITLPGANIRLHYGLNSWNIDGVERWKLLSSKRLSTLENNNNTTSLRSTSCVPLDDRLLSTNYQETRNRKEVILSLLFVLPLALLGLAWPRISRDTPFVVVTVVLLDTVALLCFGYIRILFLHHGANDTGRPIGRQGFAWK
jgi:hypothetical protein